MKPELQPTRPKRRNSWTTSAQESYTIPARPSNTPAIIVAKKNIAEKFPGFRLGARFSQ